MNIQEELNKLQRDFNSMECPDCGGLHQCRLHDIDNKNIQITFMKDLDGEPCWGYKSMVHKTIEEFKNKYH